MSAPPRFLRSWIVTLLLTCTLSSARAELRVGTAKVDVTPDQLPVLINGGMTSRSATEVKTRVNARAIVVDDGNERIGLMVVDSCMMPRSLLDEVKQLAATRTQLFPDRIMISATHTHSAPSSMGALGTDADLQYVPLLRQRLVQALEQAEAGLEPAEVGWGAGEASEFTALRRWVRRPDRIAQDPFGNWTVRANMHSARNPQDATGPSGPEDPQLSIIAFRALDGRPLAALANFSMHYFGDSAISADYFGLFCDQLEKHMSDERSTAPTSAQAPLAIMSHGCSGDIWKRDYMSPQPAAEGTIQEFTQGLLERAVEVYESIEYQTDTNIAMQEARLPMKYRVPDQQRLQWAEAIVDELGGRLPQTQPEIYAREQMYLHALQNTEVVLQAIRIGDIAIATTPNETYALTGLKLKLQSPLHKTMVIELANGGDGYIPPPEQHFLGGYNTWAARSAGLEVTAEPRIVAQNLLLLEQVCRKPRRAFMQSLGPTAAAIQRLKPVAYWRLHEMSAEPAVDASGSGHLACYEPGVVFFLDGPAPDRFATADEVNRCAHFAGGRLQGRLENLKGDFSVVLTFWNGMPTDARDITGWMFSRDYPHSTSEHGIHLGLSGTLERPGCLIVQAGLGPPTVGHTPIARWQWTSAALVRTEETLRVYLAGQDEPEIAISWDASVHGRPIEQLFFGGRSDNDDNWEGKLDEIAVYDRALSAEELGTVLGGTTSEDAASNR